MRSWKEDLRDQLIVQGFDMGSALLVSTIDSTVSELSNHLDFFNRLPPRKKQALSNIAFQIGVGSLFGFRRMLIATKHRHWSAARREALDSAWARKNPDIAHEIAEMLGEEEI